MKRNDLIKFQNGSEILYWNSTTNQMTGPYPRTQIFPFLKNEYHINSILTVTRTSNITHLLIYHRGMTTAKLTNEHQISISSLYVHFNNILIEGEQDFLTFYEYESKNLVEKYTRTFRTDAIET